MSKPNANAWKCWRNESHTVNETLFGWPRCFDCGAGPAYHNRFDYLRKSFALNIFIPTGLATSIIAPRSGVVGLHNGGDLDEGRVSVYFEGWVNGAMQYADRDVRGRWEAGVEHAAGRMVTDYPTAAQASLRADQLAPIGIYWPKTKTIVLSDEDALKEYLA